MSHITKIAVLYIKDGKILMCRKKGLDSLITLGGKIEAGETDIQCAEREVSEEAQCKVTGLSYYTTTTSERIDEPGSTIEIRWYLGNLIGTPTPREGDKVVGFEYIDEHYEREGHKIPPIVGTILKRLKEEKRI